MLKKNDTQTKLELGAMKAENVALKHSILTLEETLLKQSELISALKDKMARIENSLTKKISSSVNACENRIVKFYTDQDKNCSMRAKQVSSALQKKLDKISTKADSALKSSHSNCTSDINTTALDSKINNMQLELEYSILCRNQQV